MYAPLLPFSRRDAKWFEDSQRTLITAFKKRSQEAIDSASDFVLFRKYVCGMETYPYMYTWINELNTGQNSKFLRGIAGDDTCILAPRGSSKSTVMLQWIAWIIGVHANHGISLKILYISYVIDVASSKSRQIKAIIESERYQEVFPIVRPSKSKWGESEWAIDFAFAGLSTIEEPYTLACSGLQGAINSKRCLTGENRILTRDGYERIDTLMDAVGKEVLTYNERADRNEWGKIIATSSRKEKWIFTINTYLGKQVRCTHDHRFFLARDKRYIQAKYLKPQDELITPDGLDHVRSIYCVREAPEDVYDIETEGNHNFYVDDILVHNSHILLFDDLLKSPSEAKNKKIQDRMMENYNSIVRFTKHDGARAINLGTRMAKFDLYATTFIPVNGWKVIKQSALLSDASGEYSYCDDRVTLDTLLEERRLDEESFLLQRQNEIPEITSQGIRPHLIKWGWMPAEFERIVIGLDTADSKEENSNATAIVIVGIANDCLYVLDAFEGRVQGNLKKIDLIYDYWAKRKNDCKYPAILAVDYHRYSQGLEGDVNAYMDDIREDDSLDNDFASMTIEKVKSTGRGEKIDRIESHSYLFEKSRIIFNTVAASISEVDNTNTLKKVVGEITDYNALAHNDLMDALEVAIFTARQYISGDLSYR